MHAVSILTMSAFTPVLIILYMDHGNSFLASSLASLQTILHTFVKVSERSKISVAYGFALLKHILWLSKQLTWMNSSPTPPASSHLLPPLMPMGPDPTYTFSFLNILFYTFVFSSCYTYVWHP